MVFQRKQAVHDGQRVRELLEDVYVRDMYMKETREALAREFDDVFQMLVPKLDGRSYEAVSLRWDGLEELRTNHPKAVLPETRFEFPLVEVVGNAAMARVDVFHGPTHIYTDFVSLYRVGGDWRLVCKVFHAHLPSSPQFGEVEGESETA